MKNRKIINDTLLRTLGDRLADAGLGTRDIQNLLRDKDKFEQALLLLKEEVKVTIRYPLIDCDKDPVCPDYPRKLAFKEHIQQGKIQWNPDRMSLYLTEKQQEGKQVSGEIMQTIIMEQKVLNANVLDYLLENPEFVPKSWRGEWRKRNKIFFWGTIYYDRSRPDDLCVRYMSFEDIGEWVGRFYCISEINFDHLKPSIIIA